MLSYLINFFGKKEGRTPVVELKPFMLEDELEMYLLQNGYDLGEGVCKPGKEQRYNVDRELVVRHAMDLGYKVNYREQSYFNEFEKVA